MEVALVALEVLTIVVFFAYLHQRDGRDRRERQELVERVQRPELVPPVLSGDEPSGPLHLTEDQEDEMWANRYAEATDGT